MDHTGRSERNLIDPKLVELVKRSTADGFSERKRRMTDVREKRRIDRVDEETDDEEEEGTESTSHKL